jgi:hypothetical protein
LPETEAFVGHTACHQAGTGGQAVQRHRQPRRDARRLDFRWSLSITVLCFANFVNAQITKASILRQKSVIGLEIKFSRNFEIVTISTMVL